MASVFTQFCGINYAKIKLKGGIMAYLACLEEKELESLSGVFRSFRASMKSSPTSFSQTRMANGERSQGQGPSSPPSLGHSDLGALTASLFRLTSKLHFPWLKEPIFGLNYWGTHLLQNVALEVWQNKEVAHQESQNLNLTLSKFEGLCPFFQICMWKQRSFSA